MTWNWERTDWPNFTWNQARLAAAEKEFLVGGGVFIGAIKHLGDEDRDQLTVEAMSTEALTTSEIEGEILDRASVQSSIQRQLGLATDGLATGNRRVGPAERGISEMMIDLYRSFSGPLTRETLFGWHRMLMGDRKGLRDIGRYRTGDEPMQVITGPAGAASIHTPRIHFEAPPSERVPAEMTRFIKWYNQTAPSGPRPLPAMTRAGVSHLYFESIHPFEDGNGRVGRALAEKALAQNLGQPSLIALAATILSQRARYYEALEDANKGNEITPWLAWFAGTTIEAQRRTLALIEFLIDKTRLLDRLAGQINERQKKALLRMFQEGPEGFRGGMSAGKYSLVTGASPATTTRDLADLTDKGGLIREGEFRHAQYKLAVPLRPVLTVTINERGELVEGKSGDRRRPRNRKKRD